MEVRLAESDAEITACYPVMRELRPHIAEEAFVPRVRSQMQSGYRLAYAQADAGPVGVAGFRTNESLSWGRFLYVDDLVVLPAVRSQGVGAALLSWLQGYAARTGCGELHLDSGMQRVDAHRFYDRQGMERIGLHFRSRVAQPGADA
jgi:GNAT superfamily N-acetyltransferase